MALFVGSIFTAVKDTKTLSVSTVIGALVNTVCNFILIYYWEAYGAAVATMLGYVTVLLIRIVILRKHVTLQVKWWRDGLVYIILVVQMVVAARGMKYVLLQIMVMLTILILYTKEFRQIILSARRRVL